MARVSKKSGGCTSKLGCGCHHNDVVPPTEQTSHTKIHSHEYKIHTNTSTSDNDEVEIDGEMVNIDGFLKEMEDLLKPISNQRRQQRERAEEEALIASDQCGADNHCADSNDFDHTCSESDKH